MRPIRAFYRGCHIKNVERGELSTFFELDVPIRCEIYQLGAKTQLSANMYQLGAKNQEGVKNIPTRCKKAKMYQLGAHLVGHLVQHLLPHLLPHLVGSLFG